jgi:hypothetical protein
VLVVNAQGDVTRVSTRSSKDGLKGALGNFFKLGQEGKYRVYHNQYSTNTLALNKHQHREARPSSCLPPSSWINHLEEPKSICSQSIVLIII